jgi:hypothetical protein
MNVNVEDAQVDDNAKSTETMPETRQGRSATKITRARQTESGCAVCKVPLCRKGACWDLFDGRTP